MNVLLDLLSYNTFYNNYYYNMAISEMFLDSAQERNSMISHAKELNYLPRSRRSAKAIVTYNITASQAGNFFIIPKDTKISGKCGNTTFSFLTEKAYTAVTAQVATLANPNVPGVYLPRTFTVAAVDVFQGRLITETLDITDTDNALHHAPLRGLVRRRRAFSRGSASANPFAVAGYVLLVPVGVCERFSTWTRSRSTVLACSRRSSRAATCSDPACLARRVVPAFCCRWTLATSCSACRFSPSANRPLSLAASSLAPPRRLERRCRRARRPPAAPPR